MSVDQARRDSLKSLIRRLGLEDMDSPSLLLEVERAMTHTSSGRTDHNERLEFLGDAVLRLAATLYLDQHHPDLTVGESSSLRAQLVSDRWLAKLGEAIDIESCLILGAKALGDAAARATIRADATEALIGALYKVSGSLEPILVWLTPHWQRTSADVLAAPHRFNGKTTLQEWSQGQGLGLPEYSTEERSRQHGDPQRFHSRVQVADQLLAEGHGRSRKEAEQNAAAAAVQALAGRDAPH
jgi:ribonuclease-3